LYWIVHSDGDSEEMEADEVREAVQNYRLHLQSEDVVAETEIDAADSSPVDTSADVDDTTVVVEVNDAAPTVVSSVQSSELAVAMQAMTAAAEQLAAAATRIEAAVNRVQQPQHLQQQQPMLTVQPQLMHRHWQQQQQQHLAYYQQQQQMYWQQMYNLTQQCRR
jgi:hypothetical protein